MIVEDNGHDKHCIGEDIAGRNARKISWIRVLVEIVSLQPIYYCKLIVVYDCLKSKKLQMSKQ
jgi:hypothetical protein